MKNKNLNRVILIEIIILLITIITSILISLNIYKKTTKLINQNNGNIIGTVLEKEPNLEESLINDLILNKSNQKGNELIEKHLLYYENDELKTYIIKNVSIITLMSGIIMLLINYLLFRNNYKKIRQIDEYMNRVLNDDYSISLKDYEEGYISLLKNDIYKMTIKLKEQSNLLTKEKKYLEELLEDISHQIKTPLTSMYMINDILLNEKDYSKREEFLYKNEQQLNRIEWLIQSLLKISRLDSGTIKLKFEQVNSNVLIEKAIKPIEELIKNKNIKVNYDIENIFLYVDLNWMSEAILNILKNACEHTLDEINIKVSDNPIFTLISITDNGSGISKEDLPHIFERFYKTNTKSDSIGIGLNMSFKIVTLQNGIIEVQTSGDKTTFIIKLFKNDKFVTKKSLESNN